MEGPQRPRGWVGHGENRGREGGGQDRPRGKTPLGAGEGTIETQGTRPDVPARSGGELSEEQVGTQMLGPSHPATRRHPAWRTVVSERVGRETRRGRQGGGSVVADALKRLRD